MTRAILSTAVQIRKAPTPEQRLLAASSGTSLTPQVPTDAEIRNAMAQAIRDMEDLRLTRRAGFKPAEEPDFTIFTTPEGEVGLRLNLIVERAD